MEEEEAVTIHLPLNPIRPAAQRVRQVLVTRVALTRGRITEEDTSQTLMGFSCAFLSTRRGVILLPALGRGHISARRAWAFSRMANAVRPSAEEKEESHEGGRVSQPGASPCRTSPRAWSSMGTMRGT